MKLKKMPDPITSLSTLRATHNRLLKQRNQQSDSEQFLSEVEFFVQRGVASGAFLDTRNDRWQAQNLLDYWVNELYQARREPAQSKLIEFDPSFAPELDDSLCPYLGLDAFRIANHTYFFGRSRLVDRMLSKLETSRFLAIIGPSGSGKSSVAQAGLLPRLYESAITDSETWRYYSPIVPGTNPQASLARVIVPDDVDQATWMAEAAAKGTQDPTYLVELIDRVSSYPAVILIDQFEELFTVCEDVEKRHAFINTLMRLLEAPKARHTVIITMRTDYESNLVQYPALQSYYEESRVRVTPMKADELHDAIARPAGLVGLRFEENLVDELVREVLGEPTALPLLQFTLLKLWENREGNRVTWDTYLRLGGGRETLANSADAFYDSLPADEQAIARRVLLAIVLPTVERPISVERILRKELYQDDVPPAEIDRVVDALVAAHLLRQIPGMTDDDMQVGLAHESLARIWPRFVGWIEETRVLQRRRLRLTTTAEQWEVLRRDESMLLRGLLLEEAQQYQDLNLLEQDFVQASIAAADRERLEKEAAQRRELDQARALAEAERDRAEDSVRAARRLGWLTITLAVVFLVAVAAAVSSARNGAIARQNEATALTNEAVAEELRVTAEADASLRATAEAEAREQRDAAEANALAADTARATAVASAAEAENARTNAENARATAEASAAEAEDARAVAEGQTRLATARELAAAAIDQLQSDPQLGLLLAIEAVNRTLQEDSTAAAEAEDALYRALQAAQLQLTLSGHTDWVTDVAFSPDGARLATASLDKTVRLWDATTGQQLMTLATHSRAVNGVAFSHDGKHLASAGDDGFVFLWDAATGELLTVFNDDNGTIRALVFSPDNVHLAVAYGDTTARVWNIETKRSLYRLFGHAGSLRDVTFNEDGSLLATAGEDGRAIVWDMATGSPLYSIDPDTDSANMNGLAFAPDGRALLTAYDDGTAQVWDFREREQLFELIGHTSFVFGAAAAADGNLLATASGDGTAKVWHTETGQALSTLSGHNGGVTAVAFSPDGTRVATASQDGTAKIWSAQAGIDVLVLSRHRAAAHTVVYSADGSMVATASIDATAKVWDAASGEILFSFTEHNAAVRDIAFNPTGTLLATVSDDFNARLWDLETGELLFPFLTHDGEVSKVAFSPDGRLLLTVAAGDQVRLWDASTRARVQSITHETAVIDASFSPDQNYLALGDGRGQVVIWDLAAGEVHQVLSGHGGPVNDVVFNGDGTLLATASSDGTAKVWDLTVGEALRTFSGHAGAVMSVAFSPDGTRLATASVDRTAKLWNTATGQVLRTLLGHTASVNSIAFSPDGLRLATASSDGTAQINGLNTIDELLARSLAQVARSLSREECLQYLRGEPCLTEAEE